ncbi:nitrate chemoreceptor McpN [Aurantivibrio plasticivorans]
MRYQLSLIMDSFLRMLGCRSIKSQFAIASLAIIALAIGSTLTLYLTLSASADTVNLAGRQRMLSQRVAKEAFLVQQGAESQATIDATIELFETSHRDLLAGNPGKGILAPPNEAVETKLTQVQRAWSNYEDRIKQYISSGSTSELKALNEQSLVVLRTMNEAVGLMASVANAKTQRFQTVALLFSIAILLTSLISHFLGMNWLMTQINRLRNHLNEVASGNFSRPIHEPASDNEVSDMFSAYNRMIQQVGALSGSAKSLSHSISQQTDSLISASRTAASNTAKQSKEIEQVATAMNEMSATIREVSDHANDSERDASDVASEATASQSIVESTFNGINNMSNNLNDAVGVMQELDKESQEIGNVLTVITNIAEQTNLLALNAAIEAARAGEQGRGFAVVADEVRTLAQRTQESTEEIETIIQRLQTQARKAVEVMETSTQSAQTSSEQISEAKEALTHVVAAIKQFHQMSSLIATATQQQAEASNEIDTSINRISSATSENTQVAADVQSVSENICRDVAALNEAIDKLKTDD